MRSDMAKVIVERPRVRSRRKGKPKGSRRRQQQLGWEGLSRVEGMRRPWGHDVKALTDHLGPLRRYLDAQVGRPWNKVFGEICARINRNSVIQDHVRKHVEQYVVRHVLLIDGIPCSGEPGRSYGQPLQTARRGRLWYVCPRSGLLRRVPSVPRKNKDRGPRKGPVTVVRVSEALQCRRIDGVWHLITLEPLPLLFKPTQKRDLVLNVPLMKLTEAEARKTYGAAVYAAARRPLRKSELRQYPIPSDAWR